MSDALYDVRVSGCDDHTQITILLTDEEAELVDTVAQRINAESTFGCMPTMKIGPHVHDDDYLEDD